MIFILIVFFSKSSINFIISFLIVLEVDYKYLYIKNKLIYEFNKFKSDSNITFESILTKLNESNESNNDIDWFYEFEREYTPEEIAKIDAESRRIENDIKNGKKESRRINVSVVGNTWKDAVMLRIKMIKRWMIQLYQANDPSSRGRYVELTNNAISDLKEMGFEAEEYANHLKTTYMNIIKSYDKDDKGINFGSNQYKNDPYDDGRPIRDGY